MIGRCDMALQSAYPAYRRSSRGNQVSKDAVPALLEVAGPVEGLHVLVSGSGSLELLCELSRRGADSVTMLRPDRWIRSDTADIAFILDPSSIETLEWSVVHLRRALRPLGTLCLLLLPDTPLACIRAIDRLLSAQGFRAAHVANSGDRAVLSAELSFEGCR